MPQNPELQELFHFTSDAMPHEVFHVVRFSGTEALNELFDFTIHLVSPNLSLDCGKLLGDRAHFTLLREGSAPVVFSGYPAMARQEGHFGDYAYYTVSLRPSLWKMTKIVSSQIFLKQNMGQVIEQVLNSQAFFSFPFENQFLRQDYPAPEFAMQYDETMYDYLLWRLEEQGAYYYFSEKNGGDCICFADSEYCHKDIENKTLRYAPVSGLDFTRKGEIIVSFSMTEIPLPRRVVIRAFSWKNPLVPVVGMADAAADGVGDVYLTNEVVETEAEATTLARLRAEALCTGRRTFNGTSTVPELRPGFTFDLEKHFNEKFNRKYLLTSVTHEGSQETFLALGLGIPMHDAKDHLFYRNTFTCIESATPYRPARKAPRARISGVLNAFVDGGGSGKTPEMDEKGRYKLLFPFDVSQRNEGRASCWIRMATPSTGQLSGVNFPLLPGTEVLVSFFNGNPDLPYITGALANEEVPPLSFSGTPHYSGINTAGGSRLVFNNEEKQQGFSLQTAGGSGLHMTAGSIDSATLNAAVAASSSVVSSSSATIANVLASSGASITANGKLLQVLLNVVTAAAASIPGATATVGCYLDDKDKDDELVKARMGVANAYAGSISKTLSIAQSLYSLTLGTGGLGKIPKTPYFTTITSGGDNNSVKVQIPYGKMSIAIQMFVFLLQTIPVAISPAMFQSPNREDFDAKQNAMTDAFDSQLNKLEAQKTLLEQKLATETDDAKKQQLQKQISKLDKEIANTKAAQEKATNDVEKYWMAYKQQVVLASDVNPALALLGEAIALGAIVLKFFMGGQLRDEENFGAILLNGAAGNVNIVGKKAVSIHSHDSVLINTTAGEIFGGNSYAATQLRQGYLPPEAQHGEAKDWTTWGGPLPHYEKTAKIVFKSPRRYSSDQYKQAVTNFYNTKATQDILTNRGTDSNQFSVITQDCYIDADNKAEFILNRHKSLAGEHLIRSEENMDDQDQPGTDQYAEFKTMQNTASLTLHGNDNAADTIDAAKLFLVSENHGNPSDTNAKIALGNTRIFAQVKDAGAIKTKLALSPADISLAFENGASIKVEDKKITAGSESNLITIDKESNTTELTSETVKFTNLTFNKASITSEGKLTLNKGAITIVP